MEDAIRSLVAQNEALRLLLGLSQTDAIGAACSYLLYCAEREPQMFRRVMHEQGVREGFRGISLIEVFIRVCR